MKIIAQLCMAAAVAIATTGSAQAITVASPTPGDGGPPVAAPIIINPSFEYGAINARDFETKGAGGDLPGWVIGGSIDHISSYWSAQDGDNSVDLIGGGAGSISQTLTGLTAGTTYLLSFWVSGNPENSQMPNPKTAVLTLGSIGSTVSYTLTAANTRSTMHWEKRSYSFVATGTTALLELASNQTGYFGMAVDNFSISAVPEPATWGMMIAGFGAAGAAMRRRRRVTLRGAIA